MKFKCEYCGKEFDAKKETALYCSNSHRTAAYKLRRYHERIQATWEKECLIEQELKKQIADEKKKKRAERAMLKPIKKVNNMELINSEPAALSSASNEEERALTITTLPSVNHNLLEESAETLNNALPKSNKSNFLSHREMQNKIKSAKKAAEFNFFDFVSNICNAGKK